MPEVSVIIPTYNRAHLVERAIRSVLNQTYTDFELIVVDDCSNDNTEEVIKSFNDPRIRYIKHEKNRGVSAARNTGIKASNGKYISFLDSDDEYLPLRLEKTTSAIKSFGDKYIIYTNQKGLFAHKEIKYSAKDISRGLHISPNIVLIPKICLNDNLFDENLFCCEDWELMFRLSKKYTFKYLNEKLSIYHLENPDHIWFNSINPKHVNSALIVLEKHYNDLVYYPKALAYRYSVAGHIYFQLGDSRGKYYLIKAVSNNPTCIKYIIRLLLSFFGVKWYNKIYYFYQLMQRSRLWGKLIWYMLGAAAKCQR